MSKLLKIEKVKHGIYTRAVAGHNKIETGVVKGNKMTTSPYKGDKLKVEKAY